MTTRRGLPRTPPTVLDDLVTDSERLAALLDCAPSGRDTAELGLIDPLHLGSGERIELVAALEQQKRWLDHVQLRAVAVVEAIDGSDRSLARLALAGALRVPAPDARALLHCARTLARQLPGTLALLERGAIPTAHAEIIAVAAAQLQPYLVPGLEELVLDDAPGQTAEQFADTVRRAVRWLDPRAPDGQAPASVREQIGLIEPDRPTAGVGRQTGSVESERSTAGVRARARRTGRTGQLERIRPAAHRLTAKSRRQLDRAGQLR